MPSGVRTVTRLVTSEQPRLQECEVHPAVHAVADYIPVFAAAYFH